MPPQMPAGDWVDFVDREYLQDFVPDGGATIKFAVSMDKAAHCLVAEDLSRCAAELGYIVASVNAADTKVHMMDRIFFRIAEQVPWQRLCEDVVLTMARDEGYTVPTDATGSILARLATANNTDPDFLRNLLREQIVNKVFKQRTLSRDFRVAMTKLCHTQLTGGEEGETAAGVITDWLTGRNTSIAAVKPYQIFSRIHRTNARHFLESLLKWIRYSGRTGTLLLLDISRITIARNPRDDRLYYTKAAVLDAYEVLREVIDGTDRLDSCLIVVQADTAFLDEDTYGRGIGAYEALKFRVFDEVRDREIVNPMASLVRLTASTGGSNT